MGILKSFNTQPSRHSLKGETPDIRDGALKTSQLHAQGTNPAKVKAGASELDLDGKTPDKYQNPE
tara:strand:+ start:8048 stop:8242 length:195 start_codon:yes stop_codon:yes gene_type:complete